MPRRALLALVAGAALWAAAPAAHASRTQESMFQDDSLLVYSAPTRVAKTLDTLKTLGVDRVRVSVYWKLIAPNPESDRRPTFPAGGEDDPAAYPQEKWDRYDTIVRLAQARGIAVNFNITSPAPHWATGNPPREDLDDVWRPSADDFKQFVRALGIRYSGSYRPGATSSVLPRVEPSAAPAPLPRVDYWSIWNEPNQAAWLSPQWQTDPRDRSKKIEAAPVIYRSLVDAAGSALGGTGHASDTILVGETAPKGSGRKGTTLPIKALRFIRRLYCVDDRLRPLSGSAARAYDCPASNGATAFPAAHATLFRATGFANHPYALVTPPGVRSRDRDFAALADTSRLTRTLNTIFSRYGQRRSGGVPIYFTEFGYQSDPPDPYSGFKPSVQAAYLNQSEFIGYRNRAVRSYSQFLLLDDRPFKQYPKNSFSYWGSFQTGLAYNNGKVKPAYAAYRLPIYVPDRTRKRGQRFRVWGALRPAPNGTVQKGRIQFRRRGSHSFKTIRTVTVRNKRGYLDAHVRLRRSGQLRLSWKDPASGHVVVSRRVGVRVR